MTKEEMKEYQRKWHIEHKKERNLAGKIACGKRRKAQLKVARAILSSEDRHKLSVKELRKRYRAAGKCFYCGKDVNHGYASCPSCRAVANKAGLKYVHNTRRDAINAYGGKCACCGESNLGFLTVDHINNDGARHRKETNCGSGSKLYVWLKKNNYPKGMFQIFCWNCNCGKRDNGGICPHKGLADRNLWISREAV